MNKRIIGTDQNGASWNVVFPANEMVVIVEKGNALGIRHVEDLAKPAVKFVRVTGDKDLATGRTIESLKRVSDLEGNPKLAPTIIENSIIDPSKPTSVPDVVRAVREDKANASVVYYFAAAAAGDQVDIIRFPESINLSDKIRNAATVPINVKNSKARSLKAPRARSQCLSLRRLVHLEY